MLKSVMKLQNANRAIVGIRKIEAYCLNPNHPRGTHKARVFESALALRAEDTRELREELLRRAVTEPALTAGADEFGTRYVIDFEYDRGGRRARVRSCWIVKRGEECPRLTSCFVL